MRTHTPNMMADFSVVCVFLSLLLSSGLQPGCCQYQQINLTSSSSGVSCSSSSVFSESLDCKAAINGNTTTVWIKANDSGANCFYTNGNQGENFWQVDLGQTHNIHRITIYPDMGNPQNMRNIAVHVDQTRVFTFPSNKDNIQNPTVITNNLPLRGNIIRLTKTTAYVGLCELQVEGCVSGSHGAQCQETCCQPVGCQPDTCDSITGDCTCRTGWSPPQCQDCSPGHYSPNLGCKACGAGCEDVTSCDTLSGLCSCQRGWEPPTCHDCSPGHYSPNLGCKACGAGCEDVTSCDTLTGLCSCQRGWEPTTCHVCKTKLWGDHCNLTCDDCAGDGSCDRANGVCYFGSPSGQSDSDTNTGAIVGAVVGAAVFLGICVVIGALLIRSRRSRGHTTSDDVNGTSNTKSQDRERKTYFSQADTETSVSEEAIAPDNYDMLRSYENSDDIKPYTSLQTNQPSTHGSRTLTTTPSDTHVYELADADYENK